MCRLFAELGNMAVEVALLTESIIKNYIAISITHEFAVLFGVARHFVQAALDAARTSGSVSVQSAGASRSWSHVWHPAVYARRTASGRQTQSARSNFMRTRWPPQRPLSSEGPAMTRSGGSDSMLAWASLHRLIGWRQAISLTKDQRRLSGEIPRSATKAASQKRRLT